MARAVVVNGLSPVPGAVYVVWETPFSGFVKVGRTKVQAADRFRGGASTDNPRRLKWREFDVPNARAVEKRAHNLLKVKGIRQSPGGSEWFRCSKQAAIDAVQKARRGAGRALPERWRLAGPIPPEMTTRLYPKYRWRVGFIDTTGAVFVRKGQGISLSGSNSRDGAKAHLERMRLPTGMAAAVLWDRERGSRWRYELVTT
jgi:hypothetical protein